MLVDSGGHPPSFTCCSVLLCGNKVVNCSSTSLHRGLGLSGRRGSGFRVPIDQIITGVHGLQDNQVVVQHVTITH